VTWVVTIVGFAALIVLHEAGHFFAAKAVGMRVERFALFFPPLLFKVRRGETEYGIGAIPLGGYVRITGMNPTEEIPEEVAPRAYYRQPPWKRIVVIAAGPVVNIVLAFAIMAVVFFSVGTPGLPPVVAQTEPGTPAAKVLQPGDEVVAIDGKAPPGRTLDAQQAALVTTVSESGGAPMTLTVVRDGRRITEHLTPFFDSGKGVDRYRLGFSYDPNGTRKAISPGRAVHLAVSQMWYVTSKTVSTFAHIFESKQRKQLSGVVGSIDVTQQTFSVSKADAFMLLAVISLSLGIINLFPFLPLDGGHIFWAVAEKLRRRPIPFSVMERSGMVGFALVAVLFVIGLSNDIGRITGPGFGIK